MIKNMGDFIQVAIINNIAELTLNRPKSYNAFNLEMIGELSEKLTQFSTQDDIKGIVITGTGKSFCAGGDLEWVTKYSDNYQNSFHTLATQFHSAVCEIRRMHKPVIAAINGAAAGGGFSLALACDLRVIEKSAVLKLAYTSNGLCIDGGGTYALPRLIGMAKTLELVAFDKSITAGKALEWGLVTQVVDDGTSLDAAKQMAATIVGRSLNAFGMVKNLINDSFHTSFERVLEKERGGLGQCGKHPDGIEGIHAFLEKREPVFTK